MLDFEYSVKTSDVIKSFDCIKSNVNGRQFSVINNLILIEDQLVLFMLYLEKRRIVACNMLAKLVDF